MLPSGTVTFLFTDIEGSTKLAQEHPDALPAMLARHNAILHQAIESRNGFVFRVVGDSFSASFTNAQDAVEAALSAQRLLHNEPWTPIPIKVRMGIHTGAAQLQDDSEEPYSDYATLALTQRIMSAGHGGQILLSQSAYDLTRDRLPESIVLIDMGERRLKDVLRPERLYQLSVPDLPSEFQPLNTLESLPHNLPIQLTSFVGREKEMAEIRELLHSARLVTLTGSGGTGKTRLSQEIGVQLLPEFLHGVWLIELAPLVDPSQIIPAMAQAFGLQEHPFGPLTSLLMDYLRDKKLLLILDNCEHLIEGCAHLADDLLHHCAGLKILASSREALGIAGEVSYHTPSLADSESTRLFVERACAVNPNFHLTNSNAPAITQICSRLDGIPLAIELAAARTKLLSPEQIAARLDDRFRLLIGGSRTALPRQQTLRALIDWSYDLLSEEEKRLFRTAAVFVGGWTLDALEAVADDVNALEHLEQLVNKSLVVIEERGTEMRYFMLETIRQYAREKLFDAREASAARDRHFIYFDELGEKIWEIYRSPNAFAWRDRAEDELENLRAALDWGMVHHPEAALRLASNFCLISGALVNATTALDLLKSALDQVRSLPPVAGEANLKRQKLVASALFAQGMTGMGASGFPQVLKSFQEAASISRMTGDKRVLGYSLEMYFIASQFINAPDAPAAAEEGWVVLSELDDWWGMYMANMNMARVASRRGALEEKQKYLAIVKERLQVAPLALQSGMFYLTMGLDERLQGNHELAKQHFENGLAVFRKLRSKHFEFVMQSELGHIARTQHDFAQAKEIYRQTILGWQELGARPAIANQLECFAFLAIMEKGPQRAAKLLGAAESLREKVHAPMTDYEQIEYDQSVDELRSMLAETEFNTLWAEGRDMTMDQAIEFALRAT